MRISGSSWKTNNFGHHIQVVNYMLLCFARSLRSLGYPLFRWVSLSEVGAGVLPDRVLEDDVMVESSENENVFEYTVLQFRPRTHIDPEVP